jgi:peptide/nickel transport system substrate-binding protein
MMRETIKRATRLCAAIGIALLAPLSTALADARNNVLTIGIASEPFTLDPGQGVGGTDYPYLYSLFERILRFDPKTLEPTPGLAESWEFVGEDKTTFKFKLRPNLKFQDGTTVDAEAVKASLLHFKDDGRVKDLEVVKSIDVVDPLTVSLTLTQPYSPITAILADRAGMVISPTALKKMGKDFERAPVGAGPFQIKKWTAGSSMEIEKFPGYWDADRIKLSGITFKFIPNPTSLVSAALTGQVDYAFALDPKNLSVLKANPRIRVESEPTLSYYEIALYNGPPLDNLKVRQALAMSLDRAVLRDAIIGEGGGEGATSLPVPPSSFASTPEWANAIKYDPVKAKQLLAEAGYPDGLTLKICGSSSTGYGADIIDIEREQMKPAGFNLDVTMMTPSACLQAAAVKHDFPLLQIGFSGRPHPFLTFLQNAGSAGQYNGAHTKYPGIDEVLNKIAATYTTAEQKSLFVQLDKLWVEQVPHLPLFFRPNISVYSKAVAGELPNAQGKPDPTSIYFVDNKK